MSKSATIIYLDPIDKDEVRYNEYFRLVRAKEFSPARLEAISDRRANINVVKGGIFPSTPLR